MPDRLKVLAALHVETRVGFFGRKKIEGQAPSEVHGELDEVALEALAALLRTLGRHAIVLDATPPETVTRRFEDWARHILIRAPVPDRAPESAADHETVRDFPGLKRFVSEHRKGEAQLVGETVSGLREAARAFIRALTRLRVVGDSADLGVRQQVERLRHAASASSPIELKRDVLAAADALESAVKTREAEEETVAAELAAQVKDLSEQLEQAIREGGVDPLTRVANRKALDYAVREAVEIAGVTREPVCLVMVDLDDFKDVNDTHGHVAGDDVLKGVADALTRVVLRQRDVVARYAGDEFSVLLRDCTMTAARQRVSRIAEAIRALTFERNGERFGITASYGIGELAPDDRPETLFERADQALYRAKGAGKDRVAT